MNSYGIAVLNSGDPGVQVAVVYDYFRRVLDIYRNTAKKENIRRPSYDPTSVGFVEFMSQGDTPTLVIILRALYTMFKDGMGYHMLFAISVDSDNVGDLFTKQYEQQFTQSDVETLAEKYVKFMYFALSGLDAHGLLQNKYLLQDSDPGAEAVIKIAKMMAMLIQILTEGWTSTMGQYINTKLVDDVINLSS